MKKMIGLIITVGLLTGMFWPMGCSLIVGDYSSIDDSTVQIHGDHIEKQDKLTIQFQSQPSLNNLIVVAVAVSGGSLDNDSVEDNQASNQFILSESIPDGAFTLAIYDCVLSTVDGNYQITISPDVLSIDSMGITAGVVEFKGYSPTPVDQNNKTGPSNTPSSEKVNPQENNELLIAAMSHLGNTNNDITEDNHWSLAYENEANAKEMPLSMIYKVHDTAENETAHWKIGASAKWWVVVAGFKPEPEE